MLGNKRIMGNNIQRYMNKMGIERREFAKAIDVPYSSLTDWINGNTYPRIDKIEKMAQYFGIDKADLVEEASTRSDVKAVRIPVLGRVACGLPLEAIENVIDYEEIPAEMTRHGEYFCLMIHGDSMEPRMYDGDVVVVRKQSAADSGDIVIASVNGHDAVCKRLMLYRDHVGLLSLNSKYDPILVGSDETQRAVTIWGVVVELRGKLKGM